MAVSCRSNHAVLAVLNVRYQSKLPFVPTARLLAARKRSFGYTRSERPLLTQSGLRQSEKAKLKPTNWKDTAELIGIAAIVASLIFVGLQLKQSHDIAISNQYQARLDSVLAAKGNMLQSEAFITAMQKVERGETLGSVELTVIDLAIGQMFDLWESNYFQYVSGYVDEEHWQAVEREIEQSLSVLIVSKYWEENSRSYRDSFATVVDLLIEGRNAVPD